MVITAVYEPAAMEAVSNNIIRLLNFNFQLVEIHHLPYNAEFTHMRSLCTVMHVGKSNT